MTLRSGPPPHPPPITSTTASVSITAWSVSELASLFLPSCVYPFMPLRMTCFPHSASPRLGTQWALNTCLMQMGVQAFWGQHCLASCAVSAVTFPHRDNQDAHRLLCGFSACMQQVPNKGSSVLPLVTIHSSVGAPLPQTGIPIFGSSLEHLEFASPLLDAGDPDTSRTVNSCLRGPHHLESVLLPAQETLSCPLCALPAVCRGLCEAHTPSRPTSQGTGCLQVTVEPRLTQDASSLNTLTTQWAERVLKL